MVSIRGLTSDGVDQNGLIDRAHDLAITMFGSMNVNQDLNLANRSFFIQLRDSYITVGVYDSSNGFVTVNSPKYFNTAMNFAKEYEKLIGREDAVVLNKNYEDLEPEPQLVENQ